MSVVTVFGGTGYTGTNIVREAASRGHSVISVSRRKPKEPVEGVQYEVGAVEQLAPRVIAGADAVVAALSPRGDMAGRLVEQGFESPILRSLHRFQRSLPGLADTFR